MAVRLQPQTTPAPPTGSEYRRRNPERTPLHQTVREYLETWLAERRMKANDDSAGIPAFVERELRTFLGCGILAHGFARFRCHACRKERLVALTCKGRGICPSCGGRRMVERAADLVDRVLPAVRHRQWVLSFPPWLRWRLAWDHKLVLAVLKLFVRVVFAWYLGRAKKLGIEGGRTGCVTVIQRFGSALNLNVHFHTLIPDGVWTATADGLMFHRIGSPTREELEELTRLVAKRIELWLVRRGIWEQDEDGGVPIAAEALPEHADVLEAAVLQRGTDGRRLRRVGSSPFASGPTHPHKYRTANGFDLHAGVTVGAKRRDRLERLCRYLLRPALSNDRLERQPDGELLLRLKTRWSDGTTHLRLRPSELLDRLAALVPRPGSNQVIYHGVLAANASWRQQIVPAKAPARPRPSNPRRPNHLWADLMKRGLDLDVLECSAECPGQLRLIAVLQTPTQVRRFLRHVGLPAQRIDPKPTRSPPWAPAA